jgi:hypothetical protein
MPSPRVRDSTIGVRFMFKEQIQQMGHCPFEKLDRWALPHRAREDTMRKMMLGLAAVGCLVILPNVTSLNAQGDNPQPTCKMCPGTYIPIDELQAYLKKAIAERRTDQQVRGSISLVCGQLFSSLLFFDFHRTNLRIPPDLSPVSIRLALLFLLLTRGALPAGLVDCWLCYFRYLRPPARPD